MSPNITPKEMAEALRQHRGRLVVTAHVRPDGDALGAALGLTLGLRAGGLDAICAGVEPIAEEYRFLDGVAEIVPAAAFVPAEGDALVVVDCGDTSRIAEGMRPHAAALLRFCIDHHKSNAGFAPVRLIDPKASSSAELVLAILDAGGFPVGRAAAEALWTGLVTDTGRFSYPCTAPSTLRAAARLVECGARFDLINERVYGLFELKRLRLQRRLLDSLEVSAGGRVALASLGPADYAAESCTHADSDNFVDIPRSVKGVLVAVFLRQVDAEPSVNVSLRTREPYDASRICAAWGGGGHERAAGATIAGPLAEVRDKVRRELEALVSA